MEIVSLVDYLNNVGGAELSSRLIINGLAEHDAVDKITVVGVDDPEKERLDYPGAKIEAITPTPGIEAAPDFVGDITLSRKIAKVAARCTTNPDVIHAHHRRSTTALQQIDTNATKISTIRDFWPVCPISIYHVDGKPCTGCNNQLNECLSYQGWDGYKEPVIRRYLLAKRWFNKQGFNADHVIFIANHIRNRVSKTTDVPPSSVIYNPVNISQEPRCEPPAEPKFITASTLSKEKGIDTAIRAMKSVLEEVPNAELLVFGDGPAEQMFRDLAKTVSSDAISFYGRVPPTQLYSEIASATATIFPSIWDEPFGRITVESMTLGTPVVGARVGGIAEVIEDDSTGLLFEPGEMQELADHLVNLTTDEKLWNTISRGGINAASAFSVETIVEDHVRLYESVTSTICE